jgi:hypothetical protein
MAEAAGLAFGGIALVTLFQTCVDFLEYFETAKRIGNERQLGDNKMRLLSVRLEQWGGDLHVMHPGEEFGGLREKWSENEDMIGGSLGSIANILGDITHLTSKYGAYKKAGLSLSDDDSQYSETFCDKSQAHQSRDLHQSPSRIFTIKQRVSWAIRGKKRFDALLTELDFFITNLELVTSRLSNPSTSF